jgi:hypothetical protein
MRTDDQMGVQLHPDAVVVLYVANLSQHSASVLQVQHDAKGSVCSSASCFGNCSQVDAHPVAFQLSQQLGLVLDFRLRLLRGCCSFSCLHLLHMLRSGSFCRLYMSVVTVPPHVLSFQREGWHAKSTQLPLHALLLGHDVQILKVNDGAVDAARLAYLLQ